MVDGKDIFDLRFQITSQQTQMTRLTLAKVMNEVGARQGRVWNTQHGLSVLFDYVAAGGKPFRARQWGTAQRDGIRMAGRVGNDAELDTWQNVW